MPKRRHTPPAAVAAAAELITAAELAVWKLREGPEAVGRESLRTRQLRGLADDLGECRRQLLVLWGPTRA